MLTRTKLVIDIKLIDDNLDTVKKSLNMRGEKCDFDKITALIKQRKSLIANNQILQEQRNENNNLLKKSAKDQIDTFRSKMRNLSDQIRQNDAIIKQVQDSLDNLLLHLPNILKSDVPQGKDENDNVEIKKVLAAKKFDFPIKDHVQLGNDLGIIDIARAAKISGSRFAFLSGIGSKLNRALINYFIDFHTQKGDTELTPPFLVRESTLQSTGHLPKFRDDAFEIDATNESLFLIPTAEVPLTSYFASEILDESKMPYRFCSYSPCFRAESGSAGKDTHGLIRMHQFEKVEMVRVCTSEQAMTELDEMVDRASTLLSNLGLPHRIVQLCSGDIGFSAEKTYDLEVWVPSQNTYREVSSCSSCGTFQARRSKIRYRGKNDSGSKKAKPIIATTLNGSGLPLSRVLVAIIENYQQSDGSIKIPDCLVPYMNGQTVIN